MSELVRGKSFTCEDFIQLAEVEESSARHMDSLGFDTTHERNLVAALRFAATIRSSKKKFVAKITTGEGRRPRPSQFNAAGLRNSIRRVKEVYAPQICVCDPASVISDGPNVDCPQHGEASA